ncbi:MAG: FlgD immunoglobulin-like domain containing protein [candidate division WOR-3 bacterium]
MNFRLISSIVWLVLVTSHPLRGWTFEKRYGGPADECAIGVVATGEGGFIVVGRQESAPGFGAIFFVRTDSRGETLFTRTVSESAATIVANGFATDGVNSILIVGKKKTTRVDWDMFAMRLDFWGTPTWSLTWGSSSADDEAQAACPTPDNGWIVCGSTLGLGEYNIRVTRFTALGEVVWDRIFGSDGPDYGYSVAQAQDSGFIVAGASFPQSARFSDIYLAKLNDSGLVVWSRTFGDSLWDEARAVLVMPDQGILIGGFSSSYGRGMDAYLLRTDRTGQGIWRQTFGGEFSDRCFAICLTPGSGCVLTGETYQPPGSTADLYLVKARSDGNLLWERVFGGNGYDCGTAIIRLPDGGFAVAGVTWIDSLHRKDMFLIRTDSTGIIGIESADSQPPGFCLQAFPNPFRSLTAVSFTLGAERQALLSIYDLAGRVVKTLSASSMNPGVQRIIWDGRDGQGRQLPPGIYLCRLVAGSWAAQERLVRAR